MSTSYRPRVKRQAIPRTRSRRSPPGPGQLDPVECTVAFDVRTPEVTKERGLFAVENDCAPVTRPGEAADRQDGAWGHTSWRPLRQCVIAELDELNVAGRGIELAVADRICQPAPVR